MTEDSELLRRLTLENEALARRRGPHGRTLVRPAARIGQPYDLLRLNFTAETLTLSPDVSTEYASSAPLAIDPQIPLGAYNLVWPEVLNFEVDNAALRGTFVSFLAITLDDDSEFELNGAQMICDTGGFASISGPLPNDVASIGSGRKIKSARIRLQADGPGTATASLAVGTVEVYLIRSRLGRTFEFP